MAQFFLRLATYSLFAIVFVLGVGRPTEAQRVGLVWAGANYNTPTQNQIIGNEVIKSRVQWVLMDIVWAPLEEHAPTPSCQPANGPDCYYGPHSTGYHNYNFTLLDQNITQLHNAGIQVGIRIDAPPPMWSAGNLCEGGCNGYGVIMSDHYTTFKNAIYDLYYNLASRYKNTANFWAIWNEPNSLAFSPQVLEDGYLTDEYMTLIQFPAHNALTAVIPTATIIGPEFAVPANGNDGPSCDYWSHCINWLNGWTYSMLNYFDGFFPTFTFHSYPTYDTLGTFNAINNIWNAMVARGKQRQIWITEFNVKNPGYGGGTCSYSANQVSESLQFLATNMTNQRVFLWTNWDLGACPLDQYGILEDAANNFAEKPIVYDEFTETKGVLGCYYDQSNRDLPVGPFTIGNNEGCQSNCYSLGYKYAGMQYRNQCFCGNSYGKYGIALNQNCNMQCASDPAQICGGSWANSIYPTGR